MKYLLTILLSCLTLLSFSQTPDPYEGENKKFHDGSSEKYYFIEKADKIDTVESIIVYVGGLEEPSIVMYGDQVRVLFTFEQVQKMNNKYRMVELLEEVIKKYGIESNIDVGIVNSLENEIYLLQGKVEILNGRIEGKDITIAKLELVIATLEKKSVVSDEASKKADAIIAKKDKEIKKLKKHKVFIAIGSGILIVLIVLAAI